MNLLSSLFGIQTSELKALKELFPAEDEEKLQLILRKHNNDLTAAIDELIEAQAEEYKKEEKGGEIGNSTSFVTLESQVDLDRLRETQQKVQYRKCVVDCPLDLPALILYNSIAGENI